MPRDMATVLKGQLGELLFTVAVQMQRIEALEEENAALRQAKNEGMTLPHGGAPQSG